MSAKRQDRCGTLRVKRHDDTQAQTPALSPLLEGVSYSEPSFAAPPWTYDDKVNVFGRALIFQHIRQGEIIFSFEFIEIPENKDNAITEILEFLDRCDSPLA